MSESMSADAVPPTDGARYAHAVIGIWGQVMAGTADADLCMEHLRSEPIQSNPTDGDREMLIRALTHVDQYLGEECTEYYSGIITALASLILAHAEATRRAGHHFYSYQLINACVEALEEHGPPDSAVFGQFLRANLLDDLAQYEDALFAYNELLSRLDGILDQGLYDECRINRILTLLNLGKVTEAVREWDRLLPALELSRDKASLANIYNSYAATFIENGQIERANEECQNALEYAIHNGKPSTIANCWVNMGNVCLRREEFDRALYCYDQALEIHANDILRAFDHELQAVEGEAGCRMNRAVALKRSGSPAGDVIAEYEKSLRLLEGIHLESGISACRLNLGIILGQVGRHGEALALFEQTDVAKLARLDQYQYHGAFGKALYHAGDKTRALIELSTSRAVLEGDLALSEVDDTSLDFISARQHNLYAEVDLALELRRESQAYEAICTGKASIFGSLRHRAAQPLTIEPPSLVQARGALVERIRAGMIGTGEMDRSETAHPALKSFLSQWRLAQPTSKNRTINRPEQIKRSVDLPDIQAALPSQWALIDFWWTGTEELAAFVVTQNDLIVERLTFPRHSSRLGERLIRLQATLTGNDQISDDEALSDLDFYLFEPLRKHLKGIKGLYLVPHGYLHALPLHASRRYEDGNDIYLGDEFQLSYLPSARLLPQLSIPRWEGGIFSMANPERGGANTLPFAEWEIQALRQKLKGTHGDYCSGRQATTDRLKGWGNASLLHFGCHGAGMPSFSPLSHLSLSDDLLLAHDVLYRYPPLRDGSLIVLNGCETGVRDWRAVDEGLGLMTAFLLRGAGMVLASQWKVNDCCAAEMAIAFVEAWTQGETATLALRKAQTRVRNMNTDAIIERCEEVYRYLSVAQLRLERAHLRRFESIVCTRGGMTDLARQFAHEACDDFLALGQPEEAKRITATRAAIKDLPQAVEPISFSHPRYWAAFQLVGRVS